MDELVKKYINTLEALERAKDELKVYMRENKLKKIIVPGYGYVRYWAQQRPENIALIKPKEDKDEVSV